ncbi:GbpC/Spa domain-containing protein [Streptococcus hyovaginalis]
MEQRNQKLRIVSGVLFSSALFMSSQVQAQADTTASPVSSTVASPATPPESTSNNIGSAQPITTSGDASLNSSLTRAQTEGVLLVEAPTEVVASASEKAQDYQAQAASVDAVTKQYQAEKARYLKDEQAHKDYLAKQSQYQKDLATYQAYQKEKAIYDQQMKAYNLEKASYDMAYAEAQGNTTKTGYLPEVLAQNLIFRLEPDAVQTITGKVLSDEQLSKAIKNHVGWIDPGTILGSPKLVTVTSRHKSNSVLMAVGDTVVVDYSDLQHSSFSGHTIKTVRYTYRLVSTSHYSGQVVFQALSDPTVTSFTHVYHKDAKTSSAFDMEMTVQFFDINGKELLPTPENYALTSFASLNSLNGEGEYAGDYNGQFIPINGSTITVQNGRAANFSNTRQIDVVGEWDDKDNPNAYIGAIVGKSTERIQFHFGNSKGSAIWFAFNSDVKVSGGLLTPPKAPVAPEVVIKPTAPKALTKPIAPLRPIVFYHQVKVVIPKPPQAVRPLKPTKRTTSSPNRAKVSPKPSVATVKVNKVTYQPKPIPVYYTSNTVFSTPATLNNLKKFSPKIVHKLKTVKSGVSNKREKSIEIKHSKKRNDKSRTAKEWFNYNTGVGHGQKNDTTVIRYLHSLGEAARQKYKGDKSAQNREIAQAIAHPSYKKDLLQNLFNYFGKPIRISNKSVQNSAWNQIAEAHDEDRGKIDFAHLATTLASYEKQPGLKGFFKEYIKTISTGKVVIVGNVPFVVPDLFGRDIGVLQQNSFVGDLFTAMPASDVYTDMDIMILSRHPKYKDMPMDKRLIAYYSQDLTTKRKKLFEETYGKTKKESQLRFGVELINATASLGTLGLLAYAIKKGNLKNIPKNIHRMDTMLFDGKLNQLRKTSQKVIKKQMIKPFKKHISTPIKKIYKEQKAKVIKGASILKNTVLHPKKTAAIVRQQLKKKVTKRIQTAKKVYRKVVPRPVRSAIKKVSTFVKRHLPKVFKPARRTYRPIRSRASSPRRVTKPRPARPVRKFFQKIFKPRRATKRRHR